MKKNDCITFDEAMKLNPCNGWWGDVEFVIYKKWRKCVPKKYINYIKNYKPRSNRSKNEEKLYQLIKNSYSSNVLHSVRSVISPYELDIYIPDLKLAIEYNGCYFHSIEMGTPKDYHLNKSLACRNLGIRLIHIYDFEDFDKQANLVLKLINENIDEFNKKDFNKNNLLHNIPKPTLIYSDTRLHVYGSGKLYKI